MNTNEPVSYFAPPERAPFEVLEKQNHLLSNSHIFKYIVDTLPFMLVVLNQQRQIIFANQIFLENQNLTELTTILGKRPGEILNCTYASATLHGCGTSEFCRTCGAVKSILQAQAGEKSMQECQILISNNEALDLRVWSIPFAIGEENFTIFILLDISHEKRRQILERIFFHDVLNSVGGISGLSEILPQIDDPEEMARMAMLIRRSSDHLIDEIKSHQQLNQAERHELVIKNCEIKTGQIISEVIELYARHEVANLRHLIADTVDDVRIYTDPAILRRVLGNLIKNALEATPPNGKVTITCRAMDGQVVFSVHNEQCINRQTQLQLFKRSFSTKGEGRGTGTYSIKLLTENYLNGKICFSSQENEGTTFSLELPIKNGKRPN